MNILNSYKSKFKIFLALSLFLSGSALSETQIDQTQNKPPKTEKLNYKSITDLRKIAKKNESSNSKDKVIAFSEYFKGKSYDNSLDEKLIKWDRKRDKRKLLNLENFDCISYLETILALSNIKDVPDNNKDFVKDFSNLMSSIMFAVNDVTYTGRNHFIDTEWLKSNEQFILTNSVDDLAYAKERVANIDKAALLRNQIESYAQKYVKEENREKFISKFEKDLSKFASIESKVKYISFNDFLAHKEDIEKIISDKIFIFAMVIDKPDLLNSTKSEHNIGHVGFMYMINGKILLNHASSIGSKSVEIIDFETYAKEKEHNLNSIGFSLYELK